MQLAHRLVSDWRSSQYGGFWGCFSRCDCGCTKFPHDVRKF